VILQGLWLNTMSNENTGATIELRGWNPDARAIVFIFHLRSISGLDLQAAMLVYEQLTQHGFVRVPNISAKGLELARAFVYENLVSEVVTIAEDGTQTPLPMPQAPAKLFCPNCQAQLKNHFECASCKWLGYPSKRDLWGKAGACSQCGFSYRFDGKRCSHCGNGSVSAAERQ
jgi:hypothetical protein